MAQTIAYTPAGPTVALSVGNTQHASVAVGNSVNDAVNFAEFINTGTTTVCVTMAPLPQSGVPSTPTLVFPVDGTPTVPPSFILPPSMTVGKVVTVPSSNDGFSVSAIGSAAGPSSIFVTPVTGC